MNYLMREEMLLYPKEVVSEINDFYLSPKQVAEYMGVTVQALHKSLKKLGIVTKPPGAKSHKIYAKAVAQVFEERYGPIDWERVVLTSHSVKGGIGKTTIVYLIGTLLSMLSFKVLCIDIDKQANLTNAFGIDDESDNLITMMDLCQDYQLAENNSKKREYDAEQAVIEISDYLHLIPASISLANFDMMLGLTLSNFHSIYNSVLADLIPKYDVVIFDLPADFNRTTIAAHSMTDLAILPLNVGAFSRKGIKLTYDHIKQCEHEKHVRNQEIRKKVIVNKIDARTTAAYKTIQEVSQYFDEENLCYIPIPTNQPLEDSFDDSSRKNVWKWKRTSPVTSAAKEIVEDLFSVRSSLEKIRESRLAKPEIPAQGEISLGR